MICTCWSQQVSLCKVLTEQHSSPLVWTPACTRIHRKSNVYGGTCRLGYPSFLLPCFVRLSFSVIVPESGIVQGRPANLAPHSIGFFFFLQGAGRARMCVCVCLVHWILHWLQRACSATVNLSTLNLSDLSPCACIHRVCMGLFLHVCTFFFPPLVCLHLRRTFKGTFVHVTPSRAPIPRRDEDFPSAAICVPQRPRSIWSNRLFFFRRARTTQTWTNQAHLMLHLSKRLFHPAQRLIKEQSWGLVLQILLLLLITAHISFLKNKKQNNVNRHLIKRFCFLLIHFCFNMSWTLFAWLENGDWNWQWQTITSAVLAKEKIFFYKRLLILQFITTVTFSTETLHLFSLILSIHSPSSSLCCKCQINFYDCSFFACCHHNVWH